MQVYPKDWKTFVIGRNGILLRDSVNPSASPHEMFAEYSMPAFDGGNGPARVLGRTMLSSRNRISGEVLLFNKLNVRKRRVWYVGKCEPNAVASGEFLAYQSNELDLSLLRQILITDSVTAAFCEISTGTSNSQKRIRPSAFLNFEISLPQSLSEQKRIAAALGDMDKLIENLGKRITKKRLIKKGVMQELLTGKKRLPGFKGEWKERPLGELLDYEQPQAYIVKCAEYEKNGTPVLTAGKTFILGYTNETFGVFKKVPTILFDDFLAISRFVSFPFKVKSSAVKMLSLKNKEDSLLFIKNVMDALGFVASDHQRHWLRIFSKFTIRMPDPVEQHAIAGILSDMDMEIANLETRQAKLKLIKKGMLQDLLTGKVRLRGGEA